MKARQSGARWERHAEAFLCRQGLRLLRRNFHCRLGEIDLIMTDEDTLVFVEVRFRGANSRGSGLESITQRKQVRLSRAAGVFLGRNPSLARRPCRFDVVALRGQRQGPDLHWIRNAFESALS